VKPQLTRRGDRALATALPGLPRVAPHAITPLPRSSRQGRLTDDHGIPSPVGIHHVLFAVSDADLARITTEPPLVQHLFDCEPGSRAANDLPRVSFEVEDYWGALDFILTGDTDGIDGPIGFLLTWGTPIGDIDVGYGPARALTPRQVRDVSDALAKISPESFAQRINMATLEAEGVYHADTFLEKDLVDLYAELRAFIERAAVEQSGLVIALA